MVDGKQVALLAVHLSKIQPEVAIRCRIALSASHVSDVENLLGWHAELHRHPIPQEFA